MKHLIKPLLIFFTVLSFTGCASHNDISVHKAIESSTFEKKDNVTVIVVADESLEDELTQGQLDELRDDIKDKLEYRGVTEGNDLTIKITVYTFDSGDRVKAYLGTNDRSHIADFGAMVEYFDENNELLSEIEIDVTVEYAGLLSVAQADEDTEFIRQLLKYTEKHFVKTQKQSNNVPAI